MVWYGMVWYGMVWYGMVWYCMVWYGMVWYGMINDGMTKLKKSWAQGNTVLIGDACHPMMPNLGQGGCQAMEDGYVLTNMLKEVCTCA